MSSGTPVPPPPNQPPAAGLAQGYTAQTPTQVVRQKKSKLPLIISLSAAAAVIAIVLVGIIAINVINSRQFSAQATAESYIDALNSGDRAAAQEIAPDSVPAHADTTLLDAKYLSGASTQLANAQITNTQVEGNNAVITGSYTVGEEERTFTMSAHRDGKKNLFFDNWVLTPPELETVNISVPGTDGTTVNGEGFDAQAGAADYALFPGTYEIVAPESKYVTEATETITVGFADPEGETATVAVAGEATDAFKKEVQDSVYKHIEECVKQKKFAPKGCPFAINTESESNGIKIKDDMVESSVTFKLEKQPEISAEYDSTYSTGAFSTTKEGKISYTADSKDHGSKAWSGDGPISVSGTVTIDGDKLKIEYFN